MTRARVPGRAEWGEPTAPLNRRATKRFLTEARAKVWRNAVALNLARREGRPALDARVGELAGLCASRVDDLIAPGQVVLKLIAQNAAGGDIVAITETAGNAQHLEFVEPSKRYADIIIPEGGHNEVGIDMITCKIQSILAEADEPATLRARGAGESGQTGAVS